MPAKLSTLTSAIVVPDRRVNPETTISIVSGRSRDHLIKLEAVRLVDDGEETIGALVSREFDRRFARTEHTGVRRVVPRSTHQPAAFRPSR